MYIEETGAGDGDIKVTVDGEEMTVEAVTDTNHDGIDDTAVVETDDGYLSFTDTNGDGTADVMRTLDDKGAVLSTSRFDAASGEWVTEGGQATSGGPQTAPGSGSGLIVHTAEGEQHIQGELTDTNGDGKGDTLVVTDAHGDTVVFADIDGDGDADVATEITGSGQVIVSEHRGNGEWVVVHDATLGDAAAEPARLSDSDWEVETATGDGKPGGSFHVDPVTGEWVDSSADKGGGIGGAQQPRWT
ncbi:hypothetical protein JOF53_004498 [Crossiella equi]|uniref:FG-GAP repeat n=1 Tax=Crossiella equi TaxID=130796 RepID=A0ABS5AH00_9PSEU|nr:hypothetical protein [Crossiella equi]MBP2475626.1 hypothetical protein [Crossiella equi]